MQPRRLWGAVLIAICVTSFPAVAHAWPDDVLITSLAQRRGRLGFRYTVASGVDSAMPHLRANGAYIRPAERIVVAAVEANRSTSGTQSRVQVHAIDVRPGSSTKGQVVYSNPRAYEAGSPELTGVAATSVRDVNGNVDALFILTDVNPPAAYTIDVQGETNEPRPSVPRRIVNIATNRIDPTVLPAVETGRRNGTQKIFFAYAFKEPERPGTLLRVGFLDRVGVEWRFGATSFANASALGDGRCNPGVQQSLAAAYDANLAEFTLGWVCLEETGWTAYLQRFDWNGRPRTTSPFRAHGAQSDPLHSGPVLAFNRVTGRYLFQFQHNAALVVPMSDNSFQCRNGQGGNCEDAIMPNLNNASINSIEVDYLPWVEFRMGSGSATGTRLGQGVSGDLKAWAWGGDCAAGGWCIEKTLWPRRPDGYSTVHRYVRAPGAQLALVLHLWQRPGRELAELRHTIIDEEWSKDFDE